MKFVRRFFLAVLLLSAALSHAADRERVKELSQKLMCSCGTCNATLGHCPHGINCSNHVGMMKEIEKMLDEGKDDKAVLAAFAEKFGPTVLSAPTTSGFNLLAWVMPFVALGVGMIAVAYFIRRFRSRWPETVPAAVDSRYKDRVEEELRKFSPED